MARGRSAREDVIGDHLARVRGRRSAIVAALERGPSAEERELLLRRDEALAAVERGLTVVLPEVWDLEDRPLRRPRRDEDEAVLAEIRSTAAVLALRLEERASPLTSGEELDLAAAVALYRYAHTELEDGLGGLGSFPA